MREIDRNSKTLKEREPKKKREIQRVKQKEKVMDSEN